jgi:hypothetical protein
MTKRTAMLLGTAVVAVLGGSMVANARPSVGTLRAPAAAAAASFNPFAPAAAAAPAAVLNAPVLAPFRGPVLSFRPAPRSPYRPPPSGGLF